MGDSHKTFDDDRPLPGWDDGSDRPPPWRDAASSVTFENPWLRLTRHDAIAPTGFKADYVVMRPRNLSVGVLPVHDDGTVTLVGQQRFALMNWSWEMPEGGAPFDEDPIVRAGVASVGQLTSRAGTPATVQCGGTDFSTTEPDATLA